MTVLFSKKRVFFLSKMATPLMSSMVFPSKFSSSQITHFPQSTTSRLLKPASCSPLRQVQQQSQDDNVGIMCEPCNGKGWLLCDFCKGQKTNVRAENNRIYRRCPSCRAIGYVLCSTCKVFKCVTFPNYTDGEELSF